MMPVNTLMDPVWFHLVLSLVKVLVAQSGSLLVHPTWAIRIMRHAFSRAKGGNSGPGSIWYESPGAGGPDSDQYTFTPVRNHRPQLVS